MDLTTTIIAETQLINHLQPSNKLIYLNTVAGFENEFLLIFKPEIFISEDKEQLNSILKLVISKLEKYEMHIDSVRIQNAKYLKKYNVIAHHYGVINAVASNLHQNITDEAILNFRDIYGLDFKDAQAYGALELLNNNQMDAQKLSTLWKDCEIKRLGGGIYCGKVEFNGKELYIVNGFHPPQLEHFIAERRLIVTMNISGDINWKLARTDLTGNTYPEKANIESIRGALYQQFGNFGFENVSYVINSIHLSAGPIEGLIELIRFNSAYEKDEKADLKDFSFGRLLLQNFSQKICELILTNPIVEFEGKSISLFDLTEEMGSYEAIKVLKKVTKKPFSLRNKDSE